MLKYRKSQSSNKYHNSRHNLLVLYASNYSQNSLEQKLFRVSTDGNRPLGDTLLQVNEWLLYNPDPFTVKVLFANIRGLKATLRKHVPIGVKLSDYAFAMMMASGLLMNDFKAFYLLDMLADRVTKTLQHPTRHGAFLYTRVIKV